jgi:hypothetical protein
MATDDVDEEEAVQVTDVTQNNNEEEAVEVAVGFAIELEIIGANLFPTQELDSHLSFMNTSGKKNSQEVIDANLFPTQQLDRYLSFPFLGGEKVDSASKG